MFSDAWHDLKFFVMLRDPVKRCFSYYQMITSMDGTEEQKINRGPDWQNKTFEEVINEDFCLMRQAVTHLFLGAVKDVNMPPNGTMG